MSDASRFTQADVEAVRMTKTECLACDRNCRCGHREDAHFPTYGFCALCACTHWVQAITPRQNGPANVAVWEPSWAGIVLYWLLMLAGSALVMFAVLGIREVVRHGWPAP